MSLEDRLTSLADAATRASSGIDASRALTSFRRRWRARLAASTVAAAAALAGVTVGAAQLLPRAEVGPAATPSVPGPASRSPGSSPNAVAACGLVPAEAFAALSGVPVEAHAPVGDLDLSVEVDASDVQASRVLHTSVIAAFPGQEPPEGAAEPLALDLWMVVTGSDGTVVGITESWEQPDKELVESERVLERCPDASWAGIAVPESFVVHVAAALVGATGPERLVLADPVPLFRPEPTQIDGPGSCGQIFFPDGVSESEGMIRYGLGAELMDLTVTADGRVRGHLVLRNNGEQRLTGSYVLTHVLVEADHGPYHGSVLTLAEPLELTDVVSVGAGDAMRVELDLETDACADDVLPLAPGDYTVSVQVDLATAEVGFASPALKVRVD